MIDDDVWIINTVTPTNPALVDRTGKLRIATTDPVSKVISISSNVVPPLLDRVLLHEVAHAITISRGLLPSLRGSISEEDWIAAEEWSAGLLENYGIEASILASESLDRPLCVRGYCTFAF